METTTGMIHCDVGAHEAPIAGAIRFTAVIRNTEGVACAECQARYLKMERLRADPLFEITEL